MSEVIQRSEQTQNGGTFAKVFGWLVTAVCFSLIGWFANMWLPKGGASAMPQQPPSAPSVTVEEAVDEPFNPVDNFVAHVEAVKEVDILPQIDGYITEVKFEEGCTVKEGDVLFVIDSERYSATLELRESQLASAEAAVGQAESEVKRAEAEVDRTQRLYNRLQKADKRGITESELDSAETGLAAAKASLAQAKSGVISAKAGVMQAKANIALAKFDTKHTKVYAPISGQIGKALVHVGDYVSPSKGAMARIVQMDPIRVTFPMTDRDYISWRQEIVSSGDKDDLGNRHLELVLPNGTRYNERGEWDFADNEMSSATASMMVRLSFKNPNGVLIPNTYVTLNSMSSNPKHFLTIPETAILDFENGTGVWVVQEDGTAKQTMVKVHGTYHGRTAVSEGLATGDKVVNEGCHKVKAGDKLNIRKSGVGEKIELPSEDQPAGDKQ